MINTVEDLVATTQDPSTRESRKNCGSVDFEGSVR